MDNELIVKVIEFQNDVEKLVESVVVDLTAYDDGTAEFGVTISGKEHRVYVRFPIAELVRIALTTDAREEAP